jgi:CheY-like chemotaxis protein
VILPVSAIPGEKITTVAPEVEQKKVTPIVVSTVDIPLILVVDDHPVNRELLARQLKLLGLNAETAESGKIALTMWKTGCFALVITDCHMPEMDGYTFTRAVRKIEREKKIIHTPVIAWTANARIEEKQFCQHAGMDDLLVKPVDLAQLKRVLMKWLSIVDPAPEQIPGVHYNAIDDEANSPIDYVELSKVVSDPTEYITVLQDYKSHIRTDFTKLEEALLQNNFSNLEQIAHRMKGSSQMVGATEIAHACFNTEHAAKRKNLDDVGIEIARLLNSIDELENYLLKIVSI